MLRLSNAMDRLLTIMFVALHFASPLHGHHFKRAYQTDLSIQVPSTYRLPKHLPDLDIQETRQSRAFTDRPKHHYDEQDFDEYPDESNDGSYYTVGTNIRVQHPSPDVYRKPKKGSVGDDGYSQPPRKKATKRPSPPVRAPRPDDYADYGAGVGTYTKSVRSPQKVQHLYPDEKEFKGVASKKQINKYLEDQQKLIEEAIKYQLLNDPSPLAIGKYQQFLKSQQDERIEKEYEQEINANKHLFSPNNNNNNTPRRPRKKETVRPKPKKPSRRPPQGLGNYRVPRGSNRVRFSVDV